MDWTRGMKMELQTNEDFKYVIQDISCVYFGKELTYAEMMEREDVPFKFKAIISVHISRDVDLDSKMSDHILRIVPEEFSYRIFEQLKMTIRIYYKEQKKGISGKMKEKWVHKACLLKQFYSEYRNCVAAGEAVIEDISISKLALMTIST